MKKLILCSIIFFSLVNIVYSISDTNQYRCGGIAQIKEPYLKPGMTNLIDSQIRKDLYDDLTSTYWNFNDSYYSYLIDSSFHKPWVYHDSLLKYITKQNFSEIRTRNSDYCLLISNYGFNYIDSSFYKAIANRTLHLTLHQTDFDLELFYHFIKKYNIKVHLFLSRIPYMLRLPNNIINTSMLCIRRSFIDSLSFPIPNEADSLKRLSIKNSIISTFPKNIIFYRNIENISLETNNIKEIPYCTLNMPHLKVLLLTGRIDNIDLSPLSSFQSREDTLQFIIQYENTSIRYSPRKIRKIIKELKNKNIDFAFRYWQKNPFMTYEWDIKYRE